MKPTEGPDPAMPEEYGMYDEYEGYDEDEFFYHMYFDEVSTTPLPDEFYDILESVSNSGDNSFSNYPDYFDYVLKSGARSNTSDSEISTEPSIRQSKNKRYLNFGDESSPGKSRRNSKFLKFKRRREENNSAGSSRGKRSIFPPSSGKHKSSGEDLVRKKRSSKGHKNRKHKKSKKTRLGFRKRKQIEPGVIGILDRRVPVFFRQSPFVTIALTQFVVLSTGVTTGRRRVTISWSKFYNFLMDNSLTFET